MGGGVGGQPSQGPTSSGTHNGDQDVQPGRQRAAVFAEALHHVGCRGRIDRWGVTNFTSSSIGLQVCRLLRSKSSKLAATCLLRHDADDGVGGRGAWRKWTGGIKPKWPSRAGRTGGEGAGVCRQEAAAAASGERRRKWDLHAARQGWLINWRSP